MKSVLLLTLTIIITVMVVIPAHALSPTHVWSKAMGTGESTSKAYRAEIAVDEMGNVYMIGYFTGSVDFGSGLRTALTFSDVFLAKYNGSGALVWVKQLGDATERQHGLSVAVDDDSNVYIAGGFQGSIDFGGGALTSAANSWDYFLAKFNTRGVHQWSKRFGDANDNYRPAAPVPGDLYVTTFGTDNIYLAGSFTDTIDFGGGPLSELAEFDIFLAKFNGAGTHQWSKSFHSNVGDGDGRVRAISVDPSGDVYLAGHFSAQLSFNNQISVLNSGFGDRNDIFLVKFSSGGTFLWNRAYGDPTDVMTHQQAMAMAIDPAGDVCITGWFEGGLSFGLGILEPATPTERDVFMAKINATGTSQWSKGFGDVGGQEGNAITTDDAGNIYLAGGLGAVSAIGGDLLTKGLFMGVFDTGGNHLFSTDYGDNHGSGANFPVSLAMDRFGNVFLGCQFTEPMDFGGGQLTTNPTGERDYLAKFHEVPTAVGLPQPGMNISCFPNPFNPSTTIRFTMPGAGHVSIDILDASGARVAELFNGEQTTGLHSVEWHGINEQRQPVGSGVYFARMQYGARTTTYKMVLLK